MVSRETELEGRLVGWAGEDDICWLLVRQRYGRGNIFPWREIAGMRVLIHGKSIGASKIARFRCIGSGVMVGSSLEQIMFS